MQIPLYATLRYKRRPSGKIICLQLRVSYALPVNKFKIEERDITDLADWDTINSELAALQQHYRCDTVELDVKPDVVSCIDRISAES